MPLVRLFLLCCSALLTTSLATASDILLFNTGVTDANVLLAPGAIDPHYTLVTSADPGFAGPEAYTFCDDSWPLGAGGPWLPPGGLSHWIAPRPDLGYDVANSLAPGTYLYRTTFELPQTFYTVRIDGRWASDDGYGTAWTDGNGVILLNGATPAGNGFTSAGYADWTPFTITGGFVSGWNTLDFVITNASMPAVNPSGVRVELNGSFSEFDTPEPSTVVLIALGLIATPLTHALRRSRARRRIFAGARPTSS